MNPLAWQNLIFLIPISIALMITLGSAIGIVDVDIDVDLDVDVEPGDGDLHDVFDNAKGFLELFGFGKVPFSIIIMTAMMLFGSFGVCSNIVLEPILKVPFIYGMISLGIASVGSLPLTGFICRFIGKHMPATESYVQGAQALEGREGTAYIEISEKSGVAQVRDRNSALQKIPCRTYDGLVGKGEKILVTEYDEDLKIYKVDKYPV